MHDVAIGHDIVLALNTQLAGGLGALLAAELDVVVVANDLGLNKAALKVGMDNTGRPAERSRPDEPSRP